MCISANIRKSNLRLECISKSKHHEENESRYNVIQIQSFLTRIYCFKNLEWASYFSCNPGIPKSNFKLHCAVCIKCNRKFWSHRLLIQFSSFAKKKENNLEMEIKQSSSLCQAFYKKDLIHSMASWTWTSFHFELRPLEVTSFCKTVRPSFYLKFSWLGPKQKEILLEQKRLCITKLPLTL